MKTKQKRRKGKERKGEERRGEDGRGKEWGKEFGKDRKVTMG